MPKQTVRTIKVDYLARVEGEGALYVHVRNGKLVDVQLRIFEPPRFFEAFLQGRHFTEAPDITARICGICPVAYQMSSVHAMESLCGVTVGGPLRELRRLLYCGEWIESHALHVFFLHAPDFLGYADVAAMAEDYPDLVQKALFIKKIGNRVVELLGGREIHPINVRVGGFYRVPTPQELRSLVPDLQRAQDETRAALRWAAGALTFPDFTHDYPFVALHHPTEYALNEGRIVSSTGLDIAVADYERHFTEEHVARSTALHSVLKGQGHYVVGPAARYTLNYEQLSPLAREAAQEAGLGREVRNPFQSILVRLVETLYACAEALRIIAAYEMPERPALEVAPRAGLAYGASEAPRGTLYHRYRLADDGTIVEAKIVPPTAQNQSSIEEDLRGVVAQNLALPEDQLTWRCEQTIRNYDPCISCSAHFLTLHMTREE